MPTSSCNKEPCPNCNKNEISVDINCKTCNGDGFIFFINGRRVSKEQYREYFNASVNYEDEYSIDYCFKCNRFIKYANKSPEKGLCDYCYINEQNRMEDEEEENKKELQDKLEEKLKENLLEQILIDNLHKEELKKWSGKMTFIEFDNITIHVDNIIKVKHEKYEDYFSKEKTVEYHIKIFTRDGETHFFKFQNEDECNKKYKKIQDILKESGELYTINNMEKTMPHHVRYHNEIDKATAHLIGTQKELTNADIIKLTKDKFSDVDERFIQGSDHAVNHQNKGACECQRTDKALFNYKEYNKYTRI